MILLMEFYKIVTDHPTIPEMGPPIKDEEMDGQFIPFTRTSNCRPSSNHIIYEFKLV